VVGMPWQLHALAERCRVYKTLVPPLQVSVEYAVQPFSWTRPQAKKAVGFNADDCKPTKSWLRKSLCSWGGIGRLQVAPEAKRTLETSFDQLRARLLPAASNLPY
jgi:hypothetical protein